MSYYCCIAHVIVLALSVTAVAIAAAAAAADILWIVMYVSYMRILQSEYEGLPSICKIVVTTKHKCRYK